MEGQCLMLASPEGVVHVLLSLRCHGMRAGHHANFGRSIPQSCQPARLMLFKAEGVNKQLEYFITQMLAGERPGHGLLKLVWHHLSIARPAGHGTNLVRYELGYRHLVDDAISRLRDTRLPEITVTAWL